MATTEMTSGLLMQFAESMNKSFEDTPGAFAEDDIGRLISACRFLQGMFDSVHQSIEESLKVGVIAKTFEAKYGGAIGALEVIEEKAKRAVEKAKSLRLSSDFVSAYTDLTKSIGGLREMLADVLQTIKSPMKKPVDWKRIKETEAAHARGETKRYSPTA